MKTLLVVSHPRPDSLTATVSEEFARTLRGNGHSVEVADLFSERFDPVLGIDDEPDWDDYHKQYSPAVIAEMRRIERNEAVVMIFPVYWWSIPALLKGWIDRVWNHGWAYGNAKIPVRRGWMIGIAGGDRKLFEKRGYDKAMVTGLDVGILDYCGIPERRLEVLYGALEGEDAVQALLAEARRLATEF